MSPPALREAEVGVQRRLVIGDQLSVNSGEGFRFRVSEEIPGLKPEHLPFATFFTALAARPVRDRISQERGFYFRFADSAQPS
jgi:hypothetical protein